MLILQLIMSAIDLFYYYERQSKMLNLSSIKIFKCGINFFNSCLKQTYFAHQLHLCGFMYTFHTFIYKNNCV